MKRDWDFSFRLSPEDVARGWISKARYWELVGEGLKSRGHELKDVTEVPGLGCLLIIDDGHIVYHKMMADRITVTIRPKKVSNKGGCKC